MISQISDISNRDGHATDEEKLASTSCGQKPAGAEVKGEPGEGPESWGCSDVPMSPISLASSSSEAGTEAKACRKVCGSHPRDTSGADLCLFFTGRDTDVLIN